MRMTSAVFSRPVSIMYARHRGWGRLSPLLSIWNGVRALRARWDGKEFAHTERRRQKSSEREREREREYRAGDRIDGDKHRRKPCRWSSRLTEVEATKWGKQTYPYHYYRYWQCGRIHKEREKTISSEDHLRVYREVFFVDIRLSIKSELLRYYRRFTSFCLVHSSHRTGSRI